MKKKNKIILIVIFLAIAAGAISAYIWQKERGLIKRIKVSGNIEGDEVRLSFRAEGQILELLTDEGRVVKKDDIVARLNTDELVKIRDNAEGGESTRVETTVAMELAESWNPFKKSKVSARPIKSIIASVIF